MWCSRQAPHLHHYSALTSESWLGGQIRTLAHRGGPPSLFACGCAETTRQTVSTIAGEKAQGPPKSPLIKEIETICTYELDPRNPDVMWGAQRTAIFLVLDAAYTSNPSLVEMAASRLTRAPNGQLVAVDVRVYDLVYTRVRPAVPL